MSTTHEAPSVSTGAAAPLAIEVRPERSRIVVIARGELDLTTVEPLEHQVTELRGRGFGAVVLDLRELSFIDSCGLRMLLRLDAAARRDGWSFAIIDGEGPVRRLLELTRLDGRFARG